MTNVRRLREMPPVVLDEECALTKTAQVREALATMLVGESRVFRVGVTLFQVLDRDEYVGGERGSFITKRIPGGKIVTRVQ